MKLKCAIVDDEPLAAELLKKYVLQTTSLELIEIHSNAYDYLNSETRNQIDLLFLDIQMPDLNGVELSKMIHTETLIVFTTAFEKYAIEGYKVDAIDYLLKPFNYTEFLTAVQKAKQRKNFLPSYTITSERFLFVRSESKSIRIEYDQIQFIESAKDYVKIYIQSQKEPIVTLVSLKRMLQNLPQNEFMQVHRSFIVRLRSIETIERNRILFPPHYIPIGDQFKDRFQSFINQYFF